MVSASFMRFGVAFALIGMALGVFMGATHDFSLTPVHAHVNLVGWVSMFLAGLFYQANRDRETWLAALHLILAVVGLSLMAPGVAAIARGMSWGEPFAIAGSIATFAATLILAFNVFRAQGLRRGAHKPLSQENEPRALASQ
jgi:peptidoglycan/LPS O-acetylase OafA/YrhL